MTKEAAADEIQWTPTVLLQFGHEICEKNNSDTEISRLEQLGHSLSTVFMKPLFVNYGTARFTGLLPGFIRLFIVVFLIQFPISGK